jgi:hypothetical protein
MFDMENSMSKGLYAETDYDATITDRLEREIAYWTAPEQVRNSGWWLAQVFAVIETMLLFEYHDIGSSVYIQEVTAVQRWREILLSVWDGDWEGDQYDNDSPYCVSEYRRQQRPGIIALFECLESIARMWEDIDKNHRTDMKVTPMPPEYPLPYFSIHRKIWNNREWVKTAPFTQNLIEYLLKDTIYWFSLERRSAVIGLFRDALWVDVDVLGFLCETYEQPPHVTVQAIQTWRETAIQIQNEALRDNNFPDWDESDPLYQAVMRAFDRLENAAQKYPSEWD